MGELIAFPQEQPAPRRPEQLRPAPARPAPTEPLWREAVGRTLREERTRQERTLADVSKESGISVPYLSEVERGLKEASSEVLAAVAGSLGLRLVDLTVRVARSLATETAGRPRGPVALAT